MMVLSKSNRNYWLGLLGILIIYTGYYLLIEDALHPGSIPRLVRQLGRLGSILLVYGCGSWALSQNTARWMMQLWHLIHIVLISLFLGIGALDQWMHPAPYRARLIAIFIHEFLISPVLYVGMGILKARLPGEGGKG